MIPPHLWPTLLNTDIGVAALVATVIFLVVLAGIMAIVRE